MENREVEFYADKLFITPKYLSEICKKTSGKTASEWIQNYATTRLILLLRNNKLTFTQIADSMNFSSQSFFSRYVRKVLGVSPSVYRERLRHSRQVNLYKYLIMRFDTIFRPILLENRVLYFTFAHIKEL